MLELHSIDNIWYIYCPEMKKYYYYKYKHHGGAAACMETLLSSWPEDFKKDMDYCFVHALNHIMLSEYEG